MILRCKLQWQSRVQSSKHHLKYLYNANLDPLVHHAALGFLLTHVLNCYLLCVFRYDES